MKSVGLQVCVAAGWPTVVLKVNEDTAEERRVKGNKRRVNGVDTHADDEDGDDTLAQTSSDSLTGFLRWTSQEVVPVCLLSREKKGELFWVTLFSRRQTEITSVVFFFSFAFFSLSHPPQQKQKCF